MSDNVALKRPIIYKTFQPEHVTSDVAHAIYQLTCRLLYAYQQVQSVECDTARTVFLEAGWGGCYLRHGLCETIRNVTGLVYSQLGSFVKKCFW